MRGSVPGSSVRATRPISGASASSRRAIACRTPGSRSRAIPGSRSSCAGSRSRRTRCRSCCSATTSSATRRTRISRGLLGFAPSPDDRDVYDLLVIGGGPAGLVGCALRRLRRALDDPRGERGDRRSGRHLLADRELPRLSGGSFRRRARCQSRDPGREVRGAPHPSLRGRVSGAEQRLASRRGSQTETR